MSPNHAIGYNGTLPWHIKEDLEHFKTITWGHTIIMGRKTFESLPHGALPGRRNIVLCKSHRQFKGCDTFSSIEEALKSCREEQVVFVIGGSSVYKEALQYADKLYITLVDNNPTDADTFFPILNKDEWVETKKEKHNGFSFLELLRRQKD